MDIYSITYHMLVTVKDHALMYGHEKARHAIKQAGYGSWAQHRYPPLPKAFSNIVIPMGVTFA